MIQFYYERYINNYAINYYNGLTIEEKDDISHKLGLSTKHFMKVFYKDGDEWKAKSGGITFKINNLDWYPIIKKHLDNKFIKFIRNKKLRQIDDK